MPKQRVEMSMKNNYHDHDNHHAIKTEFREESNDTNLREQ